MPRPCLLQRAERGSSTLIGIMSQQRSRRRVASNLAIPISGTHLMNNARVLATDAISVYARHLNLHSKFVRQVIASLKSRGRLAASRPISPDHTPRSIARTILALTSPTIRDAAEVEQRLGALDLSTGDGQPSLEDQLADMAEEAAGWRNGDTRFRDGVVVIGFDDEIATLENATYRGTSPAIRSGLERFAVIRNRAIAQIARDLLPASRDTN